jgi:tetratricopeptide (TPR) repeat protein
MRLLLLLCVPLIAACQSFPEPVAEPVDPLLSTTLAATHFALERGAPAAPEILAAALEAYPDSVDLRRMAQNLRFARGEDWRVYLEARAAHEATPEDAGTIYLYGRTIPDREVQRDLFEMAVRQDPALFRGWFGLASASLALDLSEEALFAARAALTVRPDEPEALLLLAGALRAEHDFAGADKVYRRLLTEHRGYLRPLLSAAAYVRKRGEPDLGLSAVLDALALAPGDFALEGAVFSQVGGPGISEAGLLRALEMIASDEETALLVRARCLHRLGRSLDARGCLTGEARLKPDEVVSLALSAGDYALAVKALQRARFPVIDPEVPDQRREAEARLDRALESARHTPDDPDCLAALSRALSGTGFAEDAVVLAARALALRPEDAALQELLAGNLAWQLFLTDVRQCLTRVREVGRGGGRPESFDEIREFLAAASLRRLGKDIVSDIEELSYPFVGEVLRTDGAGAPEEWSRRGTLMVLGARAGGEVAAFVSRLSGHYRGLFEEGVTYDLALSRGSSLSVEDDGPGSVAGFTLPGWIVLDLDVIDGTAAEVRHLAREARPADLWPAPDRETRRSTWFPGGVRERLAASIGRADDEVLLATLAHEGGHAVDADRYLPFLPSLPRTLLKFAGHGFSPANVEVGLERTAEIHSLRTSPSKRVALLNTLGFLPDARSQPPHSLAYQEIIEVLIAEIDNHPELYPSVDRRFNILQQFDRLTDEEIDRLTSRAP